MNRVYFFILLMTLVALPATGQSTGTAGRPAYSESTVYEPRTFPHLEKKKKKQKNAGKTAEPATPVTELPANNSFPLYVSVMGSDGRLVTDLKQSDFTVYVDDAEAAVEALKIPDEPVTVILLVDISPSAVAYEKDLKGYVWSIIQQFRPNDPISVMGFGSRLHIVNNPTTDRDILRKSLDKLRVEDGTSIYQTIQTVFNERLNQIPGSKTVVILTDGVDTTSKGADYVSSLAAAERIGWPVFPVYLDTFRRPGRANRSPGDAQIIDMILRSQGGRSQNIAEYEVGRHYLNDLVSLSGGRTVDRSKPVKTTISDQLSRRYLLSVKPAGEAHIGQRRRIRVRVNRSGLAVLARGSYIAN